LHICRVDALLGKTGTEFRVDGAGLVWGDVWQVISTTIQRLCVALLFEPEARVDSRYPGARAYCSKVELETMERKSIKPILKGRGGRLRQRWKQVRTYHGNDSFLARLGRKHLSNPEAKDIMIS
jgi:hypothetical protein